MSIFSQAIDDIFAVNDFQETLTAGNAVITVISYAGDTDEKFTEWGCDPGKTVSVTVKVADWSPARGEKVSFRSHEWKVDTVHTDSHNLTHTVYLKNLEAK